MGRNRRWNLQDRDRWLGTIPWDRILPWPLLCASFSASSLPPWGNSSFTGSRCHHVPLHNGPRNRARDPKSWTETHCSFFKLFKPSGSWSEQHQRPGDMHIYPQSTSRDNQLPVSSKCLVLGKPDTQEVAVLALWIPSPRARATLWKLMLEELP